MNYFISIGGSGAKVLESVIHLCAMGIMPAGELKIFIIDPDKKNGNLSRTQDTLNRYRTIQNFDVENDVPLFKTKVTLMQNGPWSPANQNATLNEIIQYNNYKNTAAGKLYQVLYTNKERTTTLNLGFRGHPSIGAATLAINQGLKNFLKDIINSANTSDTKVFLAGSVFGGTGAAGLPTIAKIIENAVNQNNRTNLHIGGVFILPYFQFTPEENVADNFFARSENFLTNTKAALKYYSQKDNLFESMYFVGDQISKEENFGIGDSAQNNSAHIVDFYAALAAADFFHNNITDPFNKIHHEKNTEFNWADFPNASENVKLKEIFVSFSKFIFAYTYLIKPNLAGLVAGNITDEHNWYKFRLQNANDLRNKDFEKYADSFMKWLSQLETIPNKEIKLIQKTAFSINPSGVNPDFFNKCSFTEDYLTMDAVSNAINEVSLKERAKSWFGGEPEPAPRFGKFLYRLYNACKVSTT